MVRSTLGALVAVSLGVAVGMLVAPGPQSTRGDSASGAPNATADQSRQLAALPLPAPGFGVPRPRLLDTDGADVTRWAAVIQPSQARERPSPTSPVVVSVSATTPEGTANLVVVDREVTRNGVAWVHARVAALPNGRTGWVRRSTLGGWQFVDTRVVVNRERLTLALYRKNKLVFTAPVGVGTSSTPTPPGRFYVRDKLTAYASPEYGPLAFGTSARSPFETGWPAGGFIGIHGTDQPDLIPGHVSHGCIRLRNAAILELGRLMPVGTPVTIR